MLVKGKGKDGTVVSALTTSAPCLRRALSELSAMVPMLRTYADCLGRIL